MWPRPGSFEIFAGLRSLVGLYTRGPPCVGVARVNPYFTTGDHLSAFRPGRACEARAPEAGQVKEVEHWSLTTLREKLVKIGAKVVRHGRVAPDTAAAQIIEKCIAGMKIAQLSRAAKRDK